MKDDKLESVNLLDPVSMCSVAASCSTSSVRLHHIIVPQVDSHSIEGMIIETKEIMQENAAKIKEGNVANAQFMAETAAVMTTFTPMRRK